VTCNQKTPEVNFGHVRDLNYGTLVSHAPRTPVSQFLHLRDILDQFNSTLTNLTNTSYSKNGSWTVSSILQLRHRAIREEWRKKSSERAREGLVRSREKY